jgi:hypothetical protein
MDSDMPVSCQYTLDVWTRSTQAHVDRKLDVHVLIDPKGRMGIAVYFEVLVLQGNLHSFSMICTEKG